MSKTAQEFPGEARAFRPSWRDGPANGREPHREGEDALEFLADLADRIAAACTDSPDGFGGTQRAMPLPGQAGAGDDYCRLPAMPCGAASPDRPGVDLFTADGHMRRLAHIQADFIRLAVAHYDGRICEVARRLGVGRSTLYRKLDQYGIDYRR